MARQALGRGLSSLLGDEGPREPSHEIGIELIEPNAEQPRSRFAETALDELARSISANGVIQPIVVRRKGGRYEIVAGERRWRAAQRAGLHKIPAVVREVSDDKLLELALIENIQREELNPMEEARAYRRLSSELGMTQELIAERVGKDRTLIATALRLLKLPEDIQSWIEEGKLSAGHGRALLLTASEAVQRNSARVIIESGCSVREAERLVRRNDVSSQDIAKKAVTVTKDPNIRSAETKLMRKLGTNVKIIPKGKTNAGRIEIEYYSNADLDRLYQIIMNTE